MNEGKTEPNFNRTNPLADFDSIEDLLKDRAAAERALNHYLNPKNQSQAPTPASTACSPSPPKPTLTRC
ncbi:hypothetical protein [Pseudomonas sp.]|uniref:hypothetical protein n=1 Tax=Pseudomonas sp. TaxID=306 RepID=UPI003A96C905